MTYVYIRDEEYRGHVIGDNYSCKFCKMAQNSWGNVDMDCPGKVPNPPWDITGGKKPNPSPGFCKHGEHNMDKMKDLTACSVVTCRCRSTSLNLFLSVSTKSGQTDTYICSFCHKEFEAKCIHSIY